MANEGQTGDDGDERCQTERGVEIRGVDGLWPIGNLKIEEVVIPEVAVDEPEQVRFRVGSERENEVSTARHPGGRAKHVKQEQNRVTNE